MGDTDPATEIAGFLRRHPPFASAGPGLVEAVAAAAVSRLLPAGASLLADGPGPADHVFVLRSGRAAVLAEGDVVEDLGPGDVVGLTSMLTGRPEGRDVRATTTVVLYQLPAESMLPLLEGRDGLRFVAGTVRRRAADAPRYDPGRPFAAGSVARVMRPAVVVPPDASVRDAAMAMTDAGATAAILRTDDGRVGICTDHDLRSRVLAPGLPPDAPIQRIATLGAVTIDPSAPVSDALVAMTEGAFRHLPVVDPAGVVLGLVEDTDLLASHAGSPLHLRRAALRARTRDDLVEVARRLPDAWAAAASAGLDPGAVTASVGAIMEGVVRQAVRLAVESYGSQEPGSQEPGSHDDGSPGSGSQDSFAWLLTGSLGRREALPSSDVDSVLVWASHEAAEDRRPLTQATQHVSATLQAAGLAADVNGVTADDARVARSQDSWRAALSRWTTHPEDADAVVYLCVLLDARGVWAAHHAAPVLADLRAARRAEALGRRLGRAALASARPPASMLPEFVGIERHRRLDLKRVGTAPITHLARWAGYLAGSGALDTPGRLTAGAEAGVLVGDEAAVLTEAFAAVQAIRLHRQLADLSAGRTPSDEVTLRTLAPFTRRELREVFRAVLRIQEDVGARLDAGRLG